MKRFFVALLCLVAYTGAYAQEITREDFRDAEWKMKTLHWQMMQEQMASGVVLDQTAYDVKYWNLNVNVTNISGQIITGKVTMTSAAVVNSLTQVDYNFVTAMTVDSVRMAGLPVAYTHSNNILLITLNHAYNVGQQFTTVVYYHGHPPGSGFGSFTWTTHNGQPIVSTLSQPEGARDWWPCKDVPHDKADSADVYITVASNLTATSNGLMVSNIDNGNGTRTFHWHESYPITTYLISLAISNYQSFTNWYVSPLSGDSMPVTNYVYPEHYSNAVEDLGITPGIIAIYAQLFGEYPFITEKYGHSIFPWGGAMEHQCNTSYGSSLISGLHWYDWIVAHELSHQWFGDMITCDIWPDIWMNEGTASYCEALWTEQVSGLQAYLNYMVNDQSVYDPSGPIYNPNPLFDGNTVYNKGSWVHHMLRGVMGDSAFLTGLYAYANNPAYMHGTVTTRQYQAAMEPFYGDSLGWFFDEWVWGMNRPQYRYSWMKQDIGGGNYEIFLHVRQIQGSPAPTLFTMPIKIYPRINGVDTLITVWNDNRIDDMRFIVIGNPTTLAFDKYNWILKSSQSETYVLNIITTELPNGYVGTYYDQVVEARGGTAPYTFSLFSGTLPPGLSLIGSTGHISGTPTTVGNYAFTIRCTDNVNATDNQDFTVGILASPLCCDVGMTPDTYPITVPPGGSFGLTGTIGNPTASPIITDVWVGVKYLSNFYQLWLFNNIPLNAGQYLNAHLNQSVPGFAPAGTYSYIAYCGDQPTKCDSAVFQFTVTGARIDGADGWTLEGGWDNASAPTEVGLVGSHPNPFNATTTITYEIPVAGDVNLEIYNIMGQKVATIVDGNIEAGRHSVTWDAANFSSGIYFYKLTAGIKVFTKRMTLLK